MAPFLLIDFRKLFGLPFNRYYLETFKTSKKNRVVEILTRSFADNNSANFVVKPGRNRVKRISNLIDYSYRIASPENGVWLDQNKKAAAICQLPGKRVPVVKQTLLDIRLAFNTIGLLRVPKVLQREAYIKKWHPSSPYLYLWFIGVDPREQGKGNGSAILQQILEYAKYFQWPVYLETSTRSNLPFYEKNGFEIYHEWQFKHAGFPLWFLKKDSL